MGRYINTIICENCERAIIIAGGVAAAVGRCSDGLRRAKRYEGSKIYANVEMVLLESGPEFMFAIRNGVITDS